MNNSKAILSNEFYRHADVKNGFENFKQDKIKKAEESEMTLKAKLDEEAKKQTNKSYKKLEKLILTLDLKNYKR